MNEILRKYIKFISLAAKFSLLRTLQIQELEKLKIVGSVLDLGSSPNKINNVTNYLKNINNLVFANKFSNEDSVIKLDLEVYGNYFNKKFDNVCLFNVLEHIKEYKNCLKIAYDSLNPEGILIGSTPFIFKIHFSPNDYFRFTNQLLKEEMSAIGFKNIEVIELGKGFFSCLYSIAYDPIKRIPFLNIVIINICLFLDYLISALFKNYKKSVPIGYFFVAQK